MTRPTLKAWFWVHKWTSLVCTVFLLLLCLTGLPLIFYEEIDHLTGAAPDVPPAAEGASLAPLDTLVARAVARFPGDTPLFVSWDDHAPAVYVTSGPRPDAPPELMHSTALHAYSGEVLEMPQFADGVMFFFYRLHTDVFMGLGGLLFMGAMGVLFVASIVSGVVVYGPFMRKLDFGVVRRGRSTRLKWLDLHNLLGVTTLAWAAVVGLTGTINTLAEPLQNAWQARELAALTGAPDDRPRPVRFASLDAAVALAKTAAPGLEPAYVSYPGTGFSGEHHYGVYMHGGSALGERLYRPVLVDAETGDLAGAPEMPLTMQVLLLSQPLHFGDYGGLPLKILWAVLDVITIVVLGSGLYLWIARRRTVPAVLLDRAPSTAPEAA